MFLRVLVKDNEIHKTGEESALREILKGMLECMKNKTIYSSDNLIVDCTNITCLELKD